MITFNEDERPRMTAGQRQSDSIAETPQASEASQNGAYILLM